MYLETFAVYFTKLCYGKSTFHMQLQDYIETIMLDFINKRSKIFNFKTFKIAFATINSKIVTSSLLLNLYSCYKRFMIKEDN